METNWNTTADLNTILNLTAERIVEHGTLAERPLLHHMAAAAGPFSPGAAAALDDWDGPEVARLRAFGMVHGVLLRALDSAAQAQLAASLRPAPVMVLAA
jgi:hypothetical protein